MNKTNTKIQLRGDSEENFIAQNPLLAVKEPTVIIGGANHGRLKIGDGVRRWNDIPYTDDDIWDTIAENRARAKTYTDEQVAEAVTKVYTPLPDVQTVDDLPTITDTTQNWLCEVTSEQYVYLCRVGQTEWARHSNKTGVVFEFELTEKLAAHGSDPEAHPSILETLQDHQRQINQLSPTEGGQTIDQAIAEQVAAHADAPEIAHPDKSVTLQKIADVAVDNGCEKFSFGDAVKITFGAFISKVIRGFSYLNRHKIEYPVGFLYEQKPSTKPPAEMFAGDWVLWEDRPVIYGLGMIPGSRVLPIKAVATAAMTGANKPAGLEVGDIILNIGTASYAIGGASTVRGGLARVTAVDTSILTCVAANDALVLGEMIRNDTEAAFAIGGTSGQYVPIGGFARLVAAAGSATTWATEAHGATPQGNAVYSVQAAVTGTSANKPVCANVGDLIINAGTTTFAIGGASTAAGGIVRVISVSSTAITCASAVDTDYEPLDDPRVLIYTAGVTYPQGAWVLHTADNGDKRFRQALEAMPDVTADIFEVKWLRAQYTTDPDYKPIFRGYDDLHPDFVGEDYKIGEIVEGAPDETLDGKVITEVICYAGYYDAVEGGNRPTFENGSHSDAIRDIQGSFGGRGQWVDSAFYNGTAENQIREGNNGIFTFTQILFKASRVVPTDSQNHPVTVSVRLWRKVSN